MKLALAAAGSIAIGSSFFAFRNPLSAGPGNETSPHAAAKVGSDPGRIKSGGQLRPSPGDELACFSGGCFWGVEEFFRHIPGVSATAVGYTGGNVPNPTYELVCTHTTGHVESVLLEFDPKKVSYRRLVDEFWKVHNPTEVDRQGPDVGSNYRSAVWTFNKAQEEQARASIRDRQKKESGPIVTRVAPIQKFYLAEDYHQQYDEKTGNNSCPVRE